MKYKFKITINKTKAQGTNTNFPYLFSELTTNIPVGFWSHVVDVGGLDIKFFDTDDITELKREIVLYDSTGYKIEAWVKIPILENSANKEIWCHYGESTRINDTDTWGYDWFVYHNQISANDSGVNVNNGVISGAVDAAGKIERALYFNGTTDHVTLNSVIDFTTYIDLSVNAWIKADDLPVVSPTNLYGVYSVVCRSKLCAVTEYGPGARGWRPFDLCVDANGKLCLFISETINCSSGFKYTFYATNDPVITIGAFHHIAVTSYRYNADDRTVNIYVDGIACAFTRVSPTGAPSPVQGVDFLTQIGSSNLDDGSTIENFHGTIDEVRIINNTILSPDYISTDYNNQNDPATFSSCGPEEGGTTTTTTTFIFEGTGPVLVNGDFIVQTGICDMNGLDVQVGL